MYPLDKYRYYTNGKKVIAVSTYAGKTVRGVAVCDPHDTFDLEKGKKLAALRCAMKIADKRVQRAESKLGEAEDIVDSAACHLDKMNRYYVDASCEKAYVQKLLNETEASL